LIIEIAETSRGSIMFFLKWNVRLGKHIIIYLVR